MFHRAMTGWRLQLLNIWQSCPPCQAWCSPSWLWQTVKEILFYQDLVFQRFCLRSEVIYFCYINTKTVSRCYEELFGEKCMNFYVLIDFKSYKTESVYHEEQTKLKETNGSPWWLQHNYTCNSCKPCIFNLHMCCIKNTQINCN